MCTSEESALKSELSRALLVTGATVKQEPLSQGGGESRYPRSPATKVCENIYQLSRRCDEAALDKLVPMRYTALRRSCWAAGSQPRQEGSKPGCAQAGVSSRSGRRSPGISVSRRLLADHQRSRIRRFAPTRLRHGRGRLCCAGERACVACAHCSIQLTMNWHTCQRHPRVK